MGGHLFLLLLTPIILAFLTAYTAMLVHNQILGYIAFVFFLTPLILILSWELDSYLKKLKRQNSTLPDRRID